MNRPVLPSGDPTRDELASVSWAAPLIAFAVFLLLRPYDGIVHDARLYVGYALADWDALGIGRDLMFEHDGQSGRTIYPMLLKAWIAALGVGRAILLVTIASLAFWFFAGWRFIGSLLDSKSDTTARVLVLLWASSLSTWYGGTSVFRIAESFATPRPLAEALVLFALGGLLVRQRRGLNAASSRSNVVVEAGTLSLAMLLHPLMALPGAMIWLWLQSDRVRAWLIGIGGAGVLVLLLPNPVGEWHPLLARSLAHFDAEWFGVLERRGALVLPSQWAPSDFSRIVVQLVTLLVCIPHVPTRLKPLLGALVAFAIASVVLTWLGGDVFRSVLLTQVQPWRVLWLVALIAPVALYLLLESALAPSPTLASNVAASSQAGPYQTAGTLLLGTAWLILDLSQSSAWLALAGGLLFTVGCSTKNGVVFARRTRCALMIIALGLWLVFAGLEAWIAFEVVNSHPDPAARWSWRSVTATGLPRNIVLMLIVAVMSRRVSPWPIKHAGVTGAAAVFLVAALALFDQRSALARRTDEALELRRSHPAETPRGDVLWLDSDIETWGLLGAPTWGGNFQGISKVFDRTLAVRWEHRTKLLDSITTGGNSRRPDLVVLRVNEQMRRAICSWPGGPAEIVVPIDDVGDDVAYSVFEPGAPNFVPPAVRGGPWRRIDRYALISCRSETGAPPA